MILNYFYCIGYYKTEIYINCIRLRLPLFEYLLITDQSTNEEIFDQLAKHFLFSGHYIFDYFDIGTDRGCSCSLII